MKNKSDNKTATSNNNLSQSANNKPSLLKAGLKTKNNNFKHNIAKKTDQSNPDETSTHPDEEAHSLLEQQSKKDNDKRVDILEKQVSAIKGISMGLTNQLKDDENVISNLNSGFDRTKQMLSKTLGKMDEMVTRGSTSVWTYVVIFVIIFLALLYKLG